jgi:hypothetical protein
MNNTQLYFAIGVPSLMVLIGVLVQGFIIGNLGSQLGARMTSIENVLGARITSLEARMLSLESSFHENMRILTGKVADIDTRLSRLEDRFPSR